MDEHAFQQRLRQHLAMGCAEKTLEKLLYNFHVFTHYLFPNNSPCSDCLLQ